MKIGVFDSGVGGLIILRAIRKELPKYDYLYLGDTKRVPYGNRTQKEIYQFTKQGVEYLFKNNCALIIVACNSASSRALRRLQREWLGSHYPDRRILGVIIPTAEAALENKHKRVGVLATRATVASKSFLKECKKIDKQVKIFHRSAPELVDLIEDGKIKESYRILEKYLEYFSSKNLESIILGCTHYPIVKDLVRKIVSKKITIVSQDEIIPKKLKAYLRRHKELDKKLSRNSKLVIDLTKITPHIKNLASRWFRKNLLLKKIKLN